MKRRFFIGERTLAFATGALILAGCSTPQTRISERPELYRTLPRRDQLLVSQGQIRIGMSRAAVWLAWGSPDRKNVEKTGAGLNEAWFYILYATHPYYPYYGPLDEYFGAPLLHDPFYLHFPPSIPYPVNVVTFANGRVASFQYLASR